MGFRDVSMLLDSIIISDWSPLAQLYPKLAGHVGPDGKIVRYRLLLTDRVRSLYPVIHG